ncbi:hypothetical protein D3C85_972450 [compost metagenome]
MLDGLLKRPVAKADHVTVVGVGEETGNAFGSAQLQVDIGVGGGAQGEGCESECREFEHAQILFSVLRPAVTETDRAEQKGPISIPALFYGYGITGGVYASVVPSAHNNTSTSGVCTSNCTNEKPIRSRAFNPSTPSNGSM